MSHTKTLYVTLIGINAYRQNALNGCIRDVLALDRILRELCLQQKDVLGYCPYFLLAPNDQDKAQLAEYKSSHNLSINFDSPTFANISQKAFAHLKQAKDGDIGVFYFSGHGSQTEAPEVFWHTKPDRKNETLVCLDSRDNDAPDARDLIDKEIAFLLWDALNGKNVHALVMMDSCHSGNITRAMADKKDTAQYRFLPSDKNHIPFSSYIGSDNPAFYDIKEGNAYFKIARYVHLAAARDHQKAQETAEGGLFTSKLTTLLRNGGTSQSYRDLMQNLSVNVRMRNPQQDPVAFALVEDDLNKQFLGDNLVPYIPTFEVRFNFERGQWIMNGGLQHGITAPVGSAKSTVSIPDDQRTLGESSIGINEVSGDFSVLNDADMIAFDKSRSDYKAVVMRLSLPALGIILSPALQEKTLLAEQIKTTFSKANFLYFKIITGESTCTNYQIDITGDDHFILTQPCSNTPLFKREKDAGSFLRNIEHFAKWLRTVEIQSASTSYRKNDFIFNIQRIEGKSFSGVDRESLAAEKWHAAPAQQTVFSYTNGYQPAFRFSMEIAPESNLQSCYISALYLDSRYGITTGLIRSDSGRLEKMGSPLHLVFLRDGREIKTIKLDIDPGYAAYGINEITDYLKIFISDKPLDVSRYEQRSLELDTNGTRGIDDDLFDQKATSRDSDWAVFDFPFRIVGPDKEKMLRSGESVNFPGFSIDVPAGFSAKAFAATGEDIFRKERSPANFEKNISGVQPEATPPVAIWGQNVTEPAFLPSLAAGDGSMLEILELKSVDGSPLSLPEGKSLIIKPNTITKTRSADDPDEVIIPCGYDEISELWYPVGSSDENGNIHIDFLPTETSGLIQTTSPADKSIGGSVKLFFRKLFKKKKRLNTLVLYRVSPEDEWEELTNEPSKMSDELEGKRSSRVVLLTHGLTGDTRHMVAALKELKELANEVQYVMTYDYENLSTPIEDAARSLSKELKEAGFGKSGMPALTVIAHSQGGLLARWLVEQEGASVYVRQLILVGVASAGSELAKLGSSVFSLLTHALNITGPIQWAISGLSLLLKALRSDPGRTLKDTNPGSDFIEKLRQSSKPENVLYSVIIGDLSLIDREVEEDDKFLQRLKKVLADKVVVPWFTHGLFKDEPNDIAVTVASATAINGYDQTANMRIVASNHLAYFRKSLAQNELMEFLKAGNDQV